MRGSRERQGNKDKVRDGRGRKKKEEDVESGRREGKGE